MKLTKNTAIEINFNGRPDDLLWHRNWKVRLGKRFWMTSDWSWYFLIWKRC